MAGISSEEGLGAANGDRFAEQIYQSLFTPY